MMGKNRYFNSDFWADQWVVDDLEPLDRLVFIYLFTNPQANLVGAYRISTRVISFGTGVEQSQVLTILEHLKPKVLYVDGWIILRNSCKNQSYHNSKINAGIKALLANLPEHIAQHVEIPNDFGTLPARKPEQTKLVDDSSMAYTRPIHESSYANSNSNSNSKPAVPAVNRGAQKQSSVRVSGRQSAGKTATTETAGFSQGNKNSYAETDALFADLQAQRLVNDQYKSWYCGLFFRLGREKVLRLASIAKADSGDGDAKKLFSNLLRKESGSQPVLDGKTASVNDLFGGRHGSATHA